jgi:uncharacterized protein (DUF486 family)
MRTIVLLTISNIFMTLAWYGHLKYREVPLYKVIVVSWLIAFFEYCFQVPANRIGSYEFTAAQLKTIQEVITLTVFAAFSVLYLKQPLRWNYLAGFALIVAAVAVIFKKWQGKQHSWQPLEPLGLGSFGRARLPAVPLAIN